MSNAINARGTLKSDPVRNFRFVAKFTPLGDSGEGKWNPNAQGLRVGFTSVSGLNISTESIPYREGQYNTTVHQIPGQTTFSPITFQRGVVLGTKQHWDWMRMLFRVNDPKSTKIAPKNSFRADIEVQVLVHPVAYSTDDGVGYGDGIGVGIGTASADLTAMRFKIYNAWPTSVAYSDLNAGDNALLVEQLTVVHEGFDLNWASVTGDTITSAGSF
jgi:phage tail-like protein